MTYDDATSRIFATGSVPDGYFGERRQVGFAFDEYSGSVLEVADCGFHQSGVPKAADVYEAYWLLEHHPTARRYVRNLQPA